MAALRSMHRTMQLIRQNRQERLERPCRFFLQVRHFVFENDVFQLSLAASHIGWFPLLIRDAMQTVQQPTNKLSCCGISSTPIFPYFRKPNAANFHFHLNQSKPNKHAIPFLSIRSSFSVSNIWASLPEWDCESAPRINSQLATQTV